MSQHSHWQVYRLCWSVVFMCDVCWQFMGSWPGPSRLSLQPHTPSIPTYPMCPGSVWSALLFLESTFILILITNSFAYDLHPSALAQVWKHLGLTHYNSGLASSSRHETHSASFLLLWYTWKKNPSPYLTFFDFSSSVSLLLPHFFFCFLPLIFSVYTPPAFLF